MAAAPIAGFYFFAYPYTGVNHTESGLVDFRPAAWSATFALWQSFADEGCVAGNPTQPWVCMLSNYSFPWISTPSFATEAQTDQVQLESHDWLPSEWIGMPPEQAYMAQWRDNMTQVRCPAPWALSASGFCGS